MPAMTTEQHYTIASAKFELAKLVYKAAPDAATLAKFDEAACELGDASYEYLTAIHNGTVS
jgi:hypothetical protein